MKWMTVSPIMLASLAGPVQAQDLYLGSSNTVVQRGNPGSGDFTIIGACGGSIHSMTSDGVDVLFGDVTGRLYRYDNASQSISYSFDLGSDAATLLVYGDELLVGGSDGSIRRLNKQTGAFLGSLQSAFPVPAMLRLGNKLYVGSNFGAVFSADLPNGPLEFFGSCGGPVGAILQHDQELLLATPGSIYRVALSDGLISSAFAIPSDPTAMVLHQGVLLIAGQDGSILRVDPATGAPLATPLDGNFDVQGMVLTALPQPGTAYCFGTACPCANNDPNAGCANSTGAGALLSAFGSASVQQDDLEFVASGMPANQFALFYMGAGVINVPFGDGQLCAGAGGYGNFRFTPLRKASASGVLALGPGIAWHAFQHFGASGQVSAGFTWNFQIWYRDGQSSPCGGNFNLSNAYAVTFQP